MKRKSKPKKRPHHLRWQKANGLQLAEKRPPRALELVPQVYDDPSVIKIWLWHSFPSKLLRDIFAELCPEHSHKHALVPVLQLARENVRFVVTEMKVMAEALCVFFQPNLAKLCMKVTNSAAWILHIEQLDSHYAARRIRLEQRRQALIEHTRLLYPGAHFEVVGSSTKWVIVSRSKLFEFFASPRQVVVGEEKKSAAPAPKTRFHILSGEVSVGKPGEATVRQNWGRYLNPRLVIRWSPTNQNFWTLLRVLREATLPRVGSKSGLAPFFADPLCDHKGFFSNLARFLGAKTALIFPTSSSSSSS